MPIVFYEKMNQIYAGRLSDMFVTTTKMCFHKAKFKTEPPALGSSVFSSNNNEISKSIIFRDKCKIIFLFIL
jgi:hypothetical protein